MGGGHISEHLLLISPAAIDESQIKAIETKFPSLQVTHVKGTGDRDELKRRLKPLYKEATILATLVEIPDQPEDAPNLKLIHFFSAGIDHYAHHPIFTHSKIPITTSSGIHGPPISEWILGSVLFLSKSLGATYESQKAHKWDAVTHRDLYFRGTDWVGKRVGIAGYGSIGRQVARLFVATGAQVIAYTASPRKTAEDRKDTGYIIPGTGDPDGTWPTAWFSGTSKDSLDTFLRAELDVLVSALPLTDATRGLIGREEFELLRDGNNGKPALFVNISRGAIVRQDELVDALNDGTLTGAALDVTEPEPLPEDSKLWDAKNAFVSPHVSALGTDYFGRSLEVLTLNLTRLERGEKLVNEVRRSRGY